MVVLTKVCLLLLVTIAMYLPTAGCTDAAVSAFPEMGRPADAESIENESLFANADENKLRRERSMASEIARSLSQLKGITRARLHLSLADNSILLKSPKKQSHAAVLIVHAPGIEPPEKNIREFLLAAVPDLTDENLKIVFTPAEATSERIVTIAGLRVAVGSAAPLKTILAVLLGTAVLAAFGLIFAGISIRRLRGSRHSQRQILK